MADKRWRQLGAMGGIIFLVIQFLAQGLIQVGGAEPSFDAGTGEIVDFFMNRDLGLFKIGSLLSVFSFIAFIWFLGVLLARLQESEEKPAWISLIAFGSGLLSVAVIIGGGGWELALFRVNESLSPDIARYAFDQGNLAFATYWVALASMMLASSVVIIRYDPLPRWLGWYGLAAALALFIARIFWDTPTFLIFVPYMLFSLWIIITSVMLFRRAAVAVEKSPS
jgi:hypothetical protein